MSEIDPRVSTPLLDWSELGVSGLLSTGMATLLLADVEGRRRRRRAVVLMRDELLPQWFRHA
jgi:hypothetical protein